MSIGSESIGQKVCSELTLNGPQCVFLVEECLSLEDKVGCNGVTQDVLDGNSLSTHGRTKLIVEMDWEKYLCDTQSHQSTHIVAEIASFTSWLKLLDMALDHGQQETLSLYRLFSKSYQGPVMVPHHVFAVTSNHLRSITSTILNYLLSFKRLGQPLNYHSSTG